MRRITVPVCVLFCFLLSAPAVAEQVDFSREIAPILQRRCLGCHAGETADGGLDLRSLATALKGGESGPAIRPGSLAESLAWQRIEADEMPENQPLPAHEKQRLREWILQGAAWVGDLDPRAVTTDTRAGFDWWSLQPLAESPIPAVQGENEGWARNAIDHFILHRLESNKLTPSREAPPAQLARRLYLDVVGLPPSPDELQSALADYGATVDRLLDSPAFGQHWARHWLDIVRFGESHGFEYNQPRDHAWGYRNWVIDAINADLPYDEFVRQQIAADVLYPDNPDCWAASGFLVAGPHNTTKPDNDKMRKTMRHDELEDMVGAIGQTFLGLTVNCARCHDHKYDPITQQEYYQIVASIGGVDHGLRDLPNEQVDQARARQQALQSELKQLRAELEQLGNGSDAGNKDSGNKDSGNKDSGNKDSGNKDSGNKDSGSENAGVSEARSLQDRVAQLEREDAELAKIQPTKLYMAITPSEKPSETRWLRRGDVTTPMEVVSAGGLQAINRAAASFGLAADSSDAERRIQLAGWLTADDNPLLARVIVNRIWHYHFGQGLVRTPSDFGFNGDRPSHPELLDYLARQLIAHGWQLKPLHRLILNSATYRQASRFREGMATVDAENRFLWRVSPRRLSAEQIRDTMLHVAGKLDMRHGGAGYRDLHEYMYRGSHYYDPIEPSGPDAFRRTIYRFNPRGAKRTILDTFDCPDPSTKTPRRQITTTPLQALSLMNNRFVFQTADLVTQRLDREAETSALRVELLYLLAFCRSPTDQERADAVRFVESEGWTAFGRVVFNSNEFLYVR